jgi:endonuclease/exonuclease/phosphatase family metal-dependent hydrolase
MLRVITQNVWGWYYFTDEGIGRTGPDEVWPVEWSSRQAVLANGFRDLAPDLVAFQEAITTPQYDQVVELLGGAYHVVHASRREPDGSGASIASRWPIRDVQEVDLQVTTRTAAFPAVTLVAEILVPQPIGPLLLVNHNPNWELSFEHERELQAVVAAQAIEGIADVDDHHVVLAGDFNATPDAASVRFWYGLQSLGGVSVCYRDAWNEAGPADPGYTQTPTNRVVAEGTWPQERGRRIDYLFVRCVHHGPTLDVTGCGHVFSQPVDDMWASDHFGVTADLRIPTRAPAALY